MTQTKKIDDTRIVGMQWPRLLIVPGVEFELRRVTAARWQALQFPVKGELLLWRVRGEWHIVSATEGRSWLTLNERRRAREFKDPVTRRQFSVGRSVLRMILSKMLNCDPADVQMKSIADDHVLVVVPDENRCVMFDVAHVGIWVVIAASAGKVGIGLIPSQSPVSSQQGFVSDATQVRARELSRNRASEAHDDVPKKRLSTSPTRWHNLDLPMPGALRGAIAVDEPIHRVTAFGWTN